MNLDSMGFIREIIYLIKEGMRHIALNALNNNVTYFDSFGVEHIPKEIKKIIENKNMKTNIFKIQAYDSAMWDIFELNWTLLIFFHQIISRYNFKLFYD